MVSEKSGRDRYGLLVLKLITDCLQTNQQANDPIKENARRYAHEYL